MVHEIRNAAARDRALPGHWSVERAREEYLRENGFSVAAYDARWTPAVLPGGIRFAVPNTKRHRWGIMLHDLHHVATGYGTDLAGEGEISAWELRRGLRPFGFYVGSIVFFGALMGLLVAPRRTLRAWRASACGRGSLAHDALPYDALLRLTVGELRQRLGIPSDGLAAGRRGRHAGAPA